MHKLLTTISAFIARTTGIVPASLEYQRGIEKARSLYEETHRRYFLIWDPQSQHLVPLTYKAFPGRTDSYEYLRLRGKFTPLSFDAFRAGSFFYTRSKYKTNEMDVDTQRQRLDILRRRYFAR